VKKAGFWFGNDRAIAFSSEVDAGSHLENVKTAQELRSDSIRTEKAKNQPENLKT
jgi:hypothetical protein